MTIPSTAANLQLQNHVTPERPISLLQSGQLLVIAAYSRGGMIIQKQHFAEIAGPGCAIGGVFDLACTKVHLLGDVQVAAPNMKAERVEAFRMRLNYSRKQQALVTEPSSLKRSVLMLRQLIKWVGIEEVGKIPSDLVAQLAATVPSTIVTAQRYLQQCHLNQPHSVQQSAAMLTPIKLANQ
ncbi:MAG: hypothetical protein AAGF24_10680 [Cyanobacteria bacterium P01_H01_bin.121]